MKKTLLATLISSLILAQVVYGQSAIVRGEVSPGVYETITTDGAQHLNVNVTGSVAPASSITATTTTPTITSSSTTILAANTARKSLLIQNNHATAIVYLNFTTTATTAHLALQPGQSLYLVGIVPTGAVRSIGSVASNTSVVVIEGA